MALQLYMWLVGPLGDRKMRTPQDESQTENSRTGPQNAPPSVRESQLLPPAPRRDLC